MKSKFLFASVMAVLMTSAVAFSQDHYGKSSEMAAKEEIEKPIREAKDVSLSGGSMVLYKLPMLDLRIECQITQYLSVELALSTILLLSQALLGGRIYFGDQEVSVYFFGRAGPYHVADLPHDEDTVKDSLVMQAGLGIDIAKRSGFRWFLEGGAIYLVANEVAFGFGAIGFGYRF